MIQSVIPFWNRLTKCNHILKEKVKKFVMVKFFFCLNFTSGTAKSNLAKGGVLLAQIKFFFLQKWFLIWSSIGSRPMLHLKKNSILSPRSDIRASDTDPSDGQTRHKRPVSAEVGFYASIVIRG